MTRSLTSFLEDKLSKRARFNLVTNALDPRALHEPIRVMDIWVLLALESYFVSRASRQLIALINEYDNASQSLPGCTNAPCNKED
jgi:hypothetical protein